MTINDLLNQSGETIIDLLKLDIEGAEVDDLQAPDSDLWLDRTRTIMVEPHDWITTGCTETFNCATARHKFRPLSRSRNNVTVTREVK